MTNFLILCLSITNGQHIAGMTYYNPTTNRVRLQYKCPAYGDRWFPLGCKPISKQGTNQVIFGMPCLEFAVFRLVMSRPSSELSK